jgi:hypothetical protein
MFGEIKTISLREPGSRVGNIAFSIFRCPRIPAMHVDKELSTSDIDADIKNASNTGIAAGEALRWIS